MRKLWGRLNSINVQKAVWALEEAGLPFDLIPAGGAHGVVQYTFYRAMNPNGLVPTLEEDGFALWESNAILRYVAATSDALVWPQDPRERAQIDQWLDWQATTLTPGMRDAFWQLFRATQPDHALIAASLAKSEDNVAILDEHFKKHGYVVGDCFTIADIALGCAVHRWYKLPAERKERINLWRWYETICNRPSAARVLNEPVS